MAPDVHSPGPMFESLAAERAAQERTQAKPAERRRSSSGRRRHRHTVRRVRRTLRHIDPLSVFKISLFFYGLFMIAWLIFVAIVYSIINSMGLFNSIEEISRGLALGWKVDITLWFVEKWALLIGVILWVTGALVNLLLSFLYNVGADTIGGIEMTFVEREQNP